MKDREKEEEVEEEEDDPAAASSSSCEQQQQLQLGAVVKVANCVNACLTARRPARGAFSSLHRRQRPSPDSHIVDIAPAFFSGRACVDPSMNVLYKLVEARRVSPSQLQRWNQCLRERRAVAAGFGAAERYVGGEIGAQPH